MVEASLPKIALTLPALPAAHQRALAMLSRHDASVSDLAAVVESDPGLTAAVLRAANSAAFAPLKRIGTAGDAVVRIGLSTTRRIVAGSALNDTFKHLDAAGIDTDALWRHSVACALLSDATAWAEGPRTEAFTAGLLHPVGRLALAAEYPARYNQVVGLVRDGAEPVAAEIEVFGFDSIEWGVQVASAWDFPEHIVAAIRDQLTGDGSPLAWVVWNGRRIAWSLGYGDGVVHPEELAFDPESEDGAIVGSLGGPDGLRAQIEWYRGAIAGV